MDAININVSDFFDSKKTCYREEVKELNSTTPFKTTAELAHAINIVICQLSYYYYYYYYYFDQIHSWLDIHRSMGH